jgi:hypothetical protein
MNILRYLTSLHVITGNEVSSIQSYTGVLIFIRIHTNGCNNMFRIDAFFKDGGIACAHWG